MNWAQPGDRGPCPICSHEMTEGMGRYDHMRQVHYIWEDYVFEGEDLSGQEDDNEMPDFDPEDFNQQEGLTNMSRMGLVVYRGVLRDGGSSNEAFAVTAAFFAGMGKSMAED